MSARPETGRGYRPRPIDTTGIELPLELKALLEALAQHQHDVWALQRLSEGWDWGLARRDGTREHPDLVPYEDLPASEREFDRRTVEQLLKALLALGWEIRPPGSRSEERGPAGTLATSETLVTYREAGQQLLRAGAPLMAYDKFREGLERWPGDLRLRQLQALALARSGATERATALLLDLYREGHRDAETLGLLAGRQKELAERAPDGDGRRALRRTARRFYEMAQRSAIDASEPAGTVFNGINAATLSLLAGDPGRATELAHQVREVCRNETGRADADRYWLHATLAEAALLLGAWGEAEEQYATAFTHGRGRWTEVASTRRQARTILRHLDRDPGLIERALPIPAVGVLSGCGAADQPALPTAASEDGIRRALEGRLGDAHIGFGYASAEPGEETLFHEVLVERGAESQLVLPVSPERYREARVASGAGGAWAERFDRILARAAGVLVANPTEVCESQATSEYAGQVRDGLAKLRARFLDTALVSLPSSAPPPSIAGSSRSGELELPAARKKVMALLFADAVGYAGLGEDQFPRFVEHFLGAVGRLVELSENAPVLRNTWGDGLFFAFDRLERAARFALELNEAISTVDWAGKGLPPSLALRIAVHTGPVFPVFDPVMQAPGYAGSHLSRAARIEPITPPGHVYASEPFAALATALGVAGLAFDYVGQTKLAKGYGRFPLYHVRRSYHPSEPA